MKIAILLYDKINLLNFAQLYSFLHSFKSASVKTYAFKSEITDELGLKIQPEIYAESLYGADMLVIPDGVGALSARYDEIFLSWVKSAFNAKFKIGFDLGALILGGAGFLENKEACIRGGYKNALNEYCAINDNNLCVSAGIITASHFSDEFRAKIDEILAER